MIVNSIDKDKLLHFFWSSILLIPLIYLGGEVYGSLWLVVIAVTKEIIHDNLMGRGNCELMDVVYGCLPIPIYFLHHAI